MHRRSAKPTTALESWSRATLELHVLSLSALEELVRGPSRPAEASDKLPLKGARIGKHLPIFRTPWSNNVLAIGDLRQPCLSGSRVARLPFGVSWT